MDDDQLELEEVQNAKRKLDQETKALQERLEEMKAENAKLARGKKKVQEEVWIPTYRPYVSRGTVRCTLNIACTFVYCVYSVCPIYSGLSSFLYSLPPPSLFLLLLTPHLPSLISFDPPSLPAPLTRCI